MKGTMNHAKNIIQHRDICRCKNLSGSIFSAATVAAVELPNLAPASGEATRNCLDIQADISFTHSLLLLRNNQADMQVQATIF
jgi:hypothetical protein